MAADNKEIGRGKIATLNAQRYQNFAQPFTLQNAKQALFSFTGDVYTDIDSEHYSAEDLTFAQAHLRIISGLYGLLCPLDLIQPYRLEMKTKLATPYGKNLYQFWGNKIAELLDQHLSEQDDQIIINLASQEYFSSIPPSTLSATVITPIFKEHKSGTYKVVGLFAKRARGAMTNWIIKHRISSAVQLKNFTESGYCFNNEMSSEHELVFTR